jgi:outer membrane protein assembly factor BamB
MASRAPWRNIAASDAGARIGTAHARRGDGLRSEAAMDSISHSGWAALCATAIAGTVASPTVPGAAPAAESAKALPYAGTPIDVTTYHYDSQRTGWNPAETALTPASVQSSKFGLLHRFKVDGDVLAQPLLVSGFVFPDGNARDVLVVATENNSVYAFDAGTYDTLWHVNFGTPQSSEDVGCLHVHPQYGVSATPVIVRRAANKASLYLVSATEPQSMVFHTQIHALDLATGKNLHAPVEIAASKKLDDGSTLKFSSTFNWIRAGMALGPDGSIYVAASSHCDNNGDLTAGWLIRYDADLKQTGSFSSIDTPAGKKLAAFWASGFAPAIDQGGNVYAVTGNGNFDKGGKDWGETVLRLPPDLAKATDWFTPAAYKALNGADLDFGSGGVLLIPTLKSQAAPPLAVAIGKDNVLYLLNRDNLGKVHAGDAGALQAQRRGPRGTGLWGGTAYYKGAAGGRVYVQSDNDVIRAYAVDTGATPSLTEIAQGTQRSVLGGSIPIVTSDGGQAGVVWVVRRRHPPDLDAYDAEKLGAPLFSAELPDYTAGSPKITPIAANGRVYIGTSGSVSVFGLAQ